jgi:hypothetical protein
MGSATGPRKIAARPGRLSNFSVLVKIIAAKISAKTTTTIAKIMSATLTSGLTGVLAAIMLVFSKEFTHTLSTKGNPRLLIATRTILAD